MGRSRTAPLILIENLVETTGHLESTVSLGDGLLIQTGFCSEDNMGIIAWLEQGGSREPYHQQANRSGFGIDGLPVVFTRR